MEDKIRALFAIILRIKPEEIFDESSPQTLNNWDSLNHLNLIASFEDEFSIDIEPEEISDMMTNFGCFKSTICKKI